MPNIPNRPRGGSKPTPAAFHVCDQCGQPFQASPADRRGAHKFCNPTCAALYREAAAGHSGPVTLPCGYCGEPVTRYASQARSQTSKQEPANFFCGRPCFQAWRHAKGAASDAGAITRARQAAAKL